MSNISWSTSLNQMLASLWKNNEPLRVAVIGMGHELRGDDAAGVIVARALKSLVTDQTHFLIIDGGSAPENHTSALRRFVPDLVLLVDAAEMNEPPGSVCWLAWESMTGLSASTHTMPPYMLAKYLSIEFGCEVALIGIQPSQLTIGKTLSPAVKKAVVTVVELLTLKVLLRGYPAELIAKK
jgi:hydrogenase 3 maturation protease